MKVHATRVLVGEAGGAARAERRRRRARSCSRTRSRVLVACGTGGTLELVTVQPEGKRAIRAAEWVMGRGVAEGDTLGV